MTKRPRRLLVLAVLSTAASLAVGVWWVWPRTAITRENAARIEKAMTLAEVAAILGGPHADAPVTLAGWPDDGPRPARVAVWTHGGDRIQVFVDRDGGVLF